jgi:hypothetical protein
VFVSCIGCVLFSWRPLQQADDLFRGVLLCVCVCQIVCDIEISKRHDLGPIWAVVLQEKISVIKVVYFSMLCYNTVFYGDIVSGTIVVPISQVCMSGMLLLLIAGNRKVCCWVGLHWHNIHVMFQENLLSFSKVEMGTHMLAQNGDLISSFFLGGGGGRGTNGK